jgi:hypothetical protein
MLSREDLNEMYSTINMGFAWKTQKFNENVAVRL